MTDIQFSHLEKTKTKLAQWLCLLPAVGLSSLCPPAPHSRTEEQFSHFSLAATEAREKLTVFVYLYLFHYWWRGRGGDHLAGICVFVYSNWIVLFYFCHMHNAGYVLYIYFSFGVNIVFLIVAEKQRCCTFSFFFWLFSFDQFNKWMIKA